ncbi:CDC48 like AAA ATPase [Cryptosporidium felis]|nr:CDC48 like AAA ATPase [Cryptosporidium felis]
MNFSNNLFIPIISSKIGIFSKCCSIINSKNGYSNEFRHFNQFARNNRPSSFKKRKKSRILIPIMKASCETSNIPLEDFKNSIKNHINSLNYDIYSIPTFTESNGQLSIRIKVKNKYPAKIISNFIEILNESSSTLQNSTVFNNWEVFENNLGREIIIELNSSTGKSKIKIYIPSDTSLPIDLEYIKHVSSLSNNDLEAIFSLFNPKFEMKNNHEKFIERRITIPDTLFKTNKISGNTLFEDETFNIFEKIFDGLNRNLIYSNSVFNDINSVFRSKRLEIPPINQFSEKLELKKDINFENNLGNDTVSALEDLGVQVYLNDEKKTDPNDKIWECLGGYEDVKNQIDEHILLNFKYPEILDKIADGTRIQKNTKNRPKMILFEGPPGTGKTTSARIIGNAIKVPLIYVSLENIVSKWYGESESRLAQIFDLSRQFNQGCIIFIDEIDTLASSRDKTFGMHEGSKKILSVLLRKLDGFDTLNSNTLLICATNRKRDMDEAFLNRIDSTVYFHLPNERERELIFRQYAKHLTLEERNALAKMSKKLSGRSIRHICLEAEREWASKLLKKRDGKELDAIELPIVDVYKEAIKKRVN